MGKRVSARVDTKTALTPICDALISDKKMGLDRLTGPVYKIQIFDVTATS